MAWLFLDPYKAVIAIRGNLPGLFCVHALSGGKLSGVFDAGYHDLEFLF